MTTYTLAGGCFWCLDALYRQLQGVTSVESGYAGGEGPATYERVSTGTTGYAEAVRITFDETIIPSEVILTLFFAVHNPTTLNRQGADVGTQYRSAMFFADETQKAVFSVARARAQAIWDDPIVTQIEPLGNYHPAEPEHQDYFRKNPEAGYCNVVITPKLLKVRSHYRQWFKEDA
jgi:peptide-methionine (S)-S-oxide reductase